MSKQILSNFDTLQAQMVGINIVGDISRGTLGPRGKNVSLDKGVGAPTITNDTVSIVRDISLSDKFENMGAETLKEIAEEIYEKLKDSTTTGVVLGQAIGNEGLKRFGQNENVMKVRDDMKKATEEVIHHLEGSARPVESINELRQIAFRSSESLEIADVVAETVNKLGKSGKITVEGSSVPGVRCEIVEGMEINEGYISSEMVTDTETMEAEYTNVPVLVTDRRISSILEMLPIIQKLIKAGKQELVIIAEDVDGDALSTFISNKRVGGFKVLAVKAPGYGERKKEELKDIAIFLGANIVSDEFGLKLDTLELNSLGTVSKVISKKKKTILIEGGGKLVDLRVKEIERQISESKSKYDIEKLEERLSNLRGQVAVIHVGVDTSTEMKYLKKKIENSINSTQMALDGGIVTGGGSSLLKSAKAVRDNLTQKSIGYEIILSACEAPFREILQNAGGGKKHLSLWNRLFNSRYLLNLVANSETDFGYDALNDELVSDMFGVGIVDPLKSATTSLKIASDRMALFLTCHAAITNND